ncbi:hypothetical protein D3C87_1318160 [compost metagenome]
MLQLVVEKRMFLVMVAQMVLLQLLQQVELQVILIPGLHQVVQMLQRLDWLRELIL